jgi:hypothetical protein
MMHEREKSDPAVAAVKPANKAEQSAAELAEPRAGAEGNASQQSTHRAQNRASVSQALARIRQAARQRKKDKFTALLHHISTDHLEQAFLELKEDAAAGVDGLRWQDYAAYLGRNLEDLHARLHRERIGRNQADGSTYPSRMADSARSPWLPWRTRSSNGRRSRC